MGKKGGSPGCNICLSDLGHKGLQHGGAVPFQVGHGGDQAGPEAQEVVHTGTGPLPGVEGIDSELRNQLDPLRIVLQRHLQTGPASLPGPRSSVPVLTALAAVMA